MDTNPYEAPRTPLPDRVDPKLREKARLILARRDDNSGGWFYFKRYWKRQALSVLLCVAATAYIWDAGYYAVAIALAGFGFGTVLRDIRWWWALAREWPQTQEFLDWDKITAIANEQTP